MSIWNIGEINSGNFKTKFDGLTNTLTLNYVSTQTTPIITLSESGVLFNEVDKNNNKVIRKFDTVESTPTQDVGTIFKKGIGFMHWNGTQYERDVSAGAEIIVNQSQRAWIKRWNYGDNRYDVLQTGFVLKSTITSPLSVSFLTNFDLGVMNVNASIVGSANPNGTSVSAGGATASNFSAYTTTGGVGIYVSYVATGWSNTSLG